MTKEELAAKVEWEGGLPEAIFGYGLSREDLPEDAPTWVRANWEVLMNAKGALRRVEEWLGDDPEGGVREPSGDSPDSPPAGRPGLPGGSGDYGALEPTGNATYPRMSLSEPVPDWPVVPAGFTYQDGGNFKMWMEPDGSWHQEIRPATVNSEAKVPS